MKSISLNYSRDFIPSPMSGWEGPPSRIEVNEVSASGQKRKVYRIRNPYFSNRKMWCLLQIEIDGVELQFAGPEELEAFIAVMETSPLPTSKTLQRKKYGDTQFHNKHWLSRLPAKAKTPKFASSFLKFVGSEPTELKEWRAFFQSEGS